MSENPAPAAPRPVSLLAIGVLLVALAGAFLIGLKIHQNPDPSATGVVTTGKGSATAAPDQLRFSVTVTNKAGQTSVAMTKTSNGIKALIAALKKAGVAEKDIQTTSVSIEPSYDYSHNKETIDGYVSSSSLRVLVRKLSDASNVISAASTAAGNTGTVQDVSMSISNKADLVAQARDKAVKNSKKAAEALAKAAGRSVDELVYVEEVTANNDGPYPMDGNFAADSAGALTPTAAPVPIAPGEQKVSVTVKVRWSLS
jgi:uncharacterized protein YggE